MLADAPSCRLPLLNQTQVQCLILLYLFQSPLSGWYPSHTITVPSFSPSVVRIQHNSRQYKSFKDDPACFYPTVFSSSSPWLCFSQSEMELFEPNYFCPIAGAFGVM
ncbi:uncharacterized protein LOC144283320 isoform X9 [Canis aureus]